MQPPPPPACSQASVLASRRRKGRLSPAAAEALDQALLAAKTRYGCEVRRTRMSRSGGARGGLLCWEWWWVRGREGEGR